MFSSSILCHEGTGVLLPPLEGCKSITVLSPQPDSATFSFPYHVAISLLSSSGAVFSRSITTV